MKKGYAIVIGLGFVGLRFGAKLAKKRFTETGINIREECGRGLKE